MAEKRDELRAADADRQGVAQRLREALDEGRLDLGEYDERLQRTYAAKTYGELDQVVADLPGTVPASQSRLARTPDTTLPGAVVPASSQPRRAVPGWLVATWGSWFTSSLVCTVIWLATGASGSFWPIWVIGPWGAVLLGRTVVGLASGEASTGVNLHERDRDERRAERDERRADRRADRDQRLDGG